MRWAVLLTAASLSAQTANAATLTEVHYVMGTYFRITIDDTDAAHARDAMRACFKIARGLDERFSRFDAASELSHLNASAADPQPAVVSAEMAALLERALTLQAETRGTFDVSVGALTQLWRTSAKWPSARSIAAAQQTDGTAAFILNGSTLIRRAGVVIDLDGIAKGWAVDRCVQRLRADGVGRALLNFGESSLYAVGAPAATGGWPVSIRGLDDDTMVGQLLLRDEAVSVSHVFGHARDIGARRVGHIVDPRTGEALTARAAAVAVADSATDAEAFSKALLVEPSAFSRVGRGALTGSLLIRPTGLQHSGAIRFTRYHTPQRIVATTEALR